MLDKIKALHEEIAALKADDTAQVEALRIKYLSKKGEINALFNDFRALAPDEKRAIGAPLNELKTFATDTINA